MLVYTAGQCRWRYIQCLSSLERENKIVLSRAERGRMSSLSAVGT